MFVVVKKAYQIRKFIRHNYIFNVLKSTLLLTSYISCIFQYSIYKMQYNLVPVYSFLDKKIYFKQGI